MIPQTEAWCRQAYERALRNAAYIKQNKYQGIPEAARVQNQLSGQAKFAACVMRRKGYIAKLRAADFAQLDASFKLSEEQRSNLEWSWQSGILWKPPLVLAEANKDRWTVTEIKGIEVSTFLATKGCYMTIQVIESEDTPATQAKLELLKAGLFNSDKVHCPISAARVTY
jgi:hypothetical protein